MHADLTNPRTHLKKPGVVAHLVILVLEWQRQADLWDSEDKEPSFLESIRPVKDPVSKNKVDGT